MSKTRVDVSNVVAENDAASVNILFYISDRASGNQPRIVVSLLNSIGDVVHRSDRPLTDYSSLSGAQKTNLRAMLVALRDETLTLENFL